MENKPIRLPAGDDYFLDKPPYKSDKGYLSKKTRDLSKT